MDEWHVVKANLPTGGDNAMPLVYFTKTFYPDGRFPAERLNGNKFQELTDNSGTTDDFYFGLSNYIAGGVKPIGSYTQIKFCKRLDPGSPQVSSGTVIRREHPADCIFRADLNYVYLQGTRITSVFYDEEYISIEEGEEPFSGTFIQGFSQATDRNIFFASSYNYEKILSSKKDMAFNIHEEIKPMQEYNTYLKRLIDTYSSVTFNNADHILGFNCNDNELAELKSIIFDPAYFIQKFPRYIKLANKQLQTINDVEYTTYDLAITGFNYSGGDIAVNTAGSSIVIYQ